MEQVALNVAMAELNSINGLMLCCVRMTLFLILAPAHYRDPSLYRKGLRNLRGQGTRVLGVDVDPIVSTNPYIDEAIVIDAGSPLTFANHTFDLIVSDSYQHTSGAETN
jgi:hypothetical protein